MNKRRRTELHAVLDGLAKLRDPIQKDEALAILQKAQTDVQRCADEEEEAHDNLPESFTWTAGSDEMVENISDLTEASDDLEILIEVCQNVEEFEYESVKSEIVRIVNAIKQSIHR